MNLRNLVPIVMMICAACAAEPTGGQDVAPTPAPGWWVWIVPGQVIGAAAPERAPGGSEVWLTALRAAAADAPLAVINLRKEVYPELADAFAASLHLPVEDYSPPTTEQADAAIAFIDDQLSQGRVVVVHCHGGCGRTGTILAVWLKRTEGLTAGDAIRRLRRLKGCFVETDGQESFVNTY